MYFRFFRLFFFLGIGLALVACNASTPTPTPASTESQNPYPVATNDISAYPALATTVPYPVEPTLDPNAIPFVINVPVIEGAIEVTGSGPAGVPILLEDVTFMGVLLAETTIESDGTFKFQVTALEKNHRIGIALGDLTGTRWTPEDFSSRGYHGPKAMQVPNVSFFYDTTLVQGP